MTRCLTSAAVSATLEDNWQEMTRRTRESLPGEWPVTERGKEHKASDNTRNILAIRRSLRPQRKEVIMNGR